MKHPALAVWLLCLLSAPLLLLTACSGTGTPAPTIRSDGKPLAGSVFGGAQPIAAATIQIYQVGTTGDGSPSLPLLNQTITTSDGSGQLNTNANAGNNFNQLPTGYFSIPSGAYVCTDSSANVYLSGVAGNPGLAPGTNNAAIEELALIGQCGALASTSFLDMNEVTTVSAAAALHPYIAAYNMIGSGPNDASAFNTAFATAVVYVNLAAGRSPGTVPAGYMVASSEVNALANSVANCVNTAGYVNGNGGACDMLFGYATPPSTAAQNANVKPADTVMALVDIRNNPNHNVAPIFNLSSNIMPFQPANATAPVDWTLPIYPIPMTPTFSVAAGTYSGPQTAAITVSNADAGTAIYYTTDGSTPTTSSAVYTTALTVSATQTVRAYAVEDQRASTSVATAAYTILVAPTISLSPAVLTSTNGLTSTQTLTAASNATGSVVSFSTTLSGVTFSAPSCTITSGTCTVQVTLGPGINTGSYANVVTASFGATATYGAATASSSVLVTVAPVVSLTAVTTPSYSPILVTITASSNAEGTTATFSATSTVKGSFMPTSCTITNGVCSVSYVPVGLASGAYAKALTASFSGNSMYSAASATSTLTVQAAATYPFGLLYSFKNGADGANPAGNLIQASDGNFYGLSAGMGSTDFGSVYMYSPANGLSVLHTFSGGADGGAPYGSLVQGTDGSLYGMTSMGGSAQAPAGNGTVFKITTAGVFTLLHTFAGGSNDAANPYGTLMQAADGNFYGLSLGGGANRNSAAGATVKSGANGYGTMFSMTPAGVVTVLHSFSAPSVRTDGSSPYGGLVQGSDGALYGMTSAGGPPTGSGTTGQGTVFRYTSAGGLALLYTFATSDGSTPLSTLIQGTDGLFYGTTSTGGNGGYGTAFRLSVGSTPTLAVLYAFGNGATGGTPSGSLLLATDGNVYGATQTGTSNSNGTLFKINPLTAPPYGITTLHPFANFSTADGGMSTGGLVQGMDGNLYGTSGIGGSYSDGTLFKLSISPAVPGPVVLTGPTAGVTHSTPFTLAYAVGNAYDTTGVSKTAATTLQSCVASNYLTTAPATVGDTTGWVGVKTASNVAQNVTLTAPAAPGTYTYALTCGGQQSGMIAVTSK